MGGSSSSSSSSSRRTDNSRSDERMAASDGSIVTRGGGSVNYSRRDVSDWAVNRAAQLSADTLEDASRVIRDGQAEAGRTAQAGLSAAGDTLEDTSRVAMLGLDAQARTAQAGLSAAGDTLEDSARLSNEALERNARLSAETLEQSSNLTRDILRDSSEALSDSTGRAWTELRGWRDFIGEAYSGAEDLIAGANRSLENAATEDQTQITQQALKAIVPLGMIGAAAYVLRG